MAVAASGGFKVVLAEAQGKILQQGEVAAMFAVGVAGGVARHGLEPAPKHFLVREDPRMAQEAEKRFLQGIPCLLFLSARHGQQEMVEAVKVKPVKLAEGLLLARRQPPCQQRSGRARRAAGWRSPHKGQLVESNREQWVGGGFGHQGLLVFLVGVGAWRGGIEAVVNRAVGIQSDNVGPGGENAANHVTAPIHCNSPLPCCRPARLPNHGIDDFSGDVDRILRADHHQQIGSLMKLELDRLALEME